jgi:hypothetical protein
MEIQDMPGKISAHIPPSLLYACRHWSYHLSSGLVSNEILKSLESFSVNKLLCWVEVSSIFGELHETLAALHRAQQLLSVSSISIHKGIIVSYMILNRNLNNISIKLQQFSMTVKDLSESSFQCLMLQHSRFMHLHYHLLHQVALYKHHMNINGSIQWLFYKELQILGIPVLEL